MSTPPIATDTPTLLPPPPRTTDGDSGFGLWLRRFFALAASCAITGCLFYFSLTVAWAYSGTDTPGQVVRAYISRGKHTSYYLVFTYTLPQGSYRDEENVSSSNYFTAQRQVPFATTVRYLHVWPFQIAGLPRYKDVWSKLLETGIIILVVCTLATFYLWAICIRPARERHLVRVGIPVLGVITDKIVRRSKYTTYSVKYTYKDSSGTQRQRRMTVNSKSKWDAVNVAEVVTVLIHPANPKRSLVYELSKYKVI